jgi:hypothetical protein
MKQIILGKLILLITMTNSLTSHAKDLNLVQDKVPVETLNYVIKKCDMLTAQKFPGRTSILKSCKLSASRQSRASLLQAGMLDFDKREATAEELEDFYNAQRRAEAVYNWALQRCYTDNKVNPLIFVNLTNYNNACIEAALNW